MRSPFSFGASKEMSLAIAGTGHRPEMLRRNTVADNARIAILLSALLMPVAIYWLIAGAALPFVIAVTGLGAGMITLALHQRRQFEQAAAGQVYALFAVGVLLALADSKIAGAGLAVALLAPVLASLVGRRQLRHLSWMLLAGFFVLSCGMMLMSPPVIPMAFSVMVGTAALSFLVAVAIVLHSAHRISMAYEVYDKTQVTAYRHLIEHVQDAVIRFSSDGEVLLASRSSEKLFGCRRFELSGSGLGERMHVLDRPNYLTAFADANQGGQVRTIEVRMRQDDARATALPRFIWVEISLSPVLDAATEGVRHEVVALFRDITDRKDGEVAMAEARRAAEEASEAKSRFLATIGHELRTPLNAIVGFSEMMTSGIGGEPTPTHKEYAGLIHQSGRHLLEVVRMLLDMSKIEAGKFELQAEAFMPAMIVQPCLNMIEAAAQERDIRLVTNIASELPMLTADERSCRQILLNLLSNAVKFSHPGGTVTVSLKRQGQSINLSVSDHGIGMAPDSIKRVGEAFFQEQNGLARRYEGTGLGLSIVKGLVDLHQGTLRAISEIGAGTTMTVLLPINGPATNLVETDTVTQLRREPPTAPIIPWQDEKRKAQ